MNRAPSADRFTELVAGAALPHTAMALAKHAPRTGTRVLHVGRGFAETTRDLTRLVGPKGTVDAFDPCAGSAWSRVEGASYDLVFAQFPELLLEGQTATLARSRRALRPGGRLLAVRWGPLGSNPWLSLPAAIALHVLPARPGQNRSWGTGTSPAVDRETTHAALASAGFAEVRIETLEAPIVVGRDLDEAIDFQLERGCAAEVLRAAGDVGREERSAMVLALRSALGPYVTARGVVMASSSWTIRATAGGDASAARG